MPAKKETEGASAQARDKGKQPSDQEVAVDQALVKGLAHPLRVRILACMNERPWSPRELEQALGEGLSQVSYHVKVLNDFKLIRLTSTRPVRGAVEHYYRAVERAFVPSQMARHIPKSAQQIAGNDILKAIDKDLGAALKSNSFYARPDWHASWTPMGVDEQGAEELEARADQHVRDAIEIQARSAARLAAGGGESISVSLAILLYGRDRGKKKRKPSSKRAPKIKAAK